MPPLAGWVFTFDLSSFCFKVLFRVGEVVYQNFLDMHCVVIGWDKVLKAPDIWVDMVSHLKEEEEEEV